MEKYYEDLAGLRTKYLNVLNLLNVNNNNSTKKTIEVNKTIMVKFLVCRKPENSFLRINYFLEHCIHL